MPKIWAVTKDMGRARGLLPVVRQLRTRGDDVQLFASGAAAGMLAGMGESFALAPTAEAALSSGDRPDLLLTSMDHPDPWFLGRDLIPGLRGTGTVVVALQDYWGGEIKTGWALPLYHPDFVCVNDKFDALLVQAAWADFDPSRILITGYPAFDAYAEALPQVQRYNTEVRRDLGIHEDEKIVLYAGQWWHSGFILGELVAALNAVSPTCLIARRHPNMLQQVPEEIPIWDQALAQFANGRVVESKHYLSVSPLVSASDVVCGIYTSVLVEACCLRKPNVSILYEDNGQADFQRETGNLMSFPPVVSLGCSRMAQTRAQLRKALTDALGGKLDLSAAQAEVFPADGKNAERVADFIRSLLA